MFTALKFANLALLILFPIAWFAPLLRAGLLPLFGLSEISVISGLQSLWGTDVFLALLVTGFALFAPYLKTIGLALIHFGMMRRKVLPVMHILGKLAMADIFLIALYVVVAKGIGVGRVEAAWGLYLFSACIIASIGISFLTERRAKAAALPAPNAEAAKPANLAQTGAH
ncbi:paraquat-inducible protein A [Alphaproteobacteria bacterium KMM 3653]|uniref:Paraquat-inducible protein A n=1 Tax=Harenicola maris TaxID=2841044 RepID=A0AAP2G6K8_9RHOB|nr:paraquat-inducible protein A [Harenicola maris]